eukprot:c14097_g1_i1.p1 GENE.c14097_g1_i1~~c14097_g1_i1.p1  ORF type:complete len:358 (+),score=95.93 c14097_g1_i1:144-1076(+)
MRDNAVELSSTFTPCGELKGHNGAIYAVDSYQNIVFTGSQDTTIKMWDGSTQNVLCTMAGHSGIVRAVAWCDKGFVISGSLDKTVKLWDPRKNNCFHTIKSKLMTELCTVSVHGSTFFTGSDDSVIRVWDARNLEKGELECIHNLQGHASSVFAILKTEENLFSGSRDHTIKIWNGSSYRYQQELTHHYDSVMALTWVKGSLASGSRDGSIKLFKDGFDVPPLSIDLTSYPNFAHTDFVLDLKKTLDESMLLSSSKDGMIKVWDVEKLGCGLTLKLHSGAVNSMAWMMGDQYLLSASQDRTVRIIKREEQ